MHLGGTFEEIASSAAAVHRGLAPVRPFVVPVRPFVVLAQQSLFDATRAPTGRHTAWASCPVPHGAAVDMTEPILRQIERFAPGFRDRILAVHAMGPAELEAHAANLVGGDSGAGRHDLGHVLASPLPWRDPYATPDRRIFPCSASTPPGPGVHGMPGYCAARSALRRTLR